MIALLTQEEAFIIGKEKATMIAMALSDVSKHYSLSVDSGPISIAKLVATLAVVNLPIMMVINAKNAARRAAKKAAATPATPEEATEVNLDRRPYNLG